MKKPTKLDQTVELIKNNPTKSRPEILKLMLSTLGFNGMSTSTYYMAARKKISQETEVVTIKCTLIELDGYNGWNASSVNQIELEEFTLECLTKHITDGETSDYKELAKDEVEVSLIANVITLNGEEGGYTCVRLSD